ncbi:folylpolyglutamate synthase/dihydrofolate synthase family protein [Halanaerocella petrolearia]
MEAINYLNNLDKFGVKPGLERVELLLDYLDNPEDNLDIIHIAGTNGKGSTSAILTAIYKEAGYKVGTYNSPHLIEFNERIRINDNNISDLKLEELVVEMQPAIDQVATELEHPTFFEVVTVLAILYFDHEDVDLAILEVGMGGRLDATNVGGSLISVITNVSLDHTDYLGETISEIALEKAGIIEFNQKVVTASQDLEVLSCLNKICKKRNSKLINVHNKFNWEKDEGDLNYQSFKLQGDKRVYNDLKLPLLGNHQLVNSALAVAVVEELLDDFPLSKAEIRSGLLQVEWPGRLEVLSKKPTVVLDGAHNQKAANKIKDTLQEWEYNNLFLVISILADKNIDGIVKELTPQAEEVVLSQNKNSRVADITKIKEEVVPYNSNVKSKPELAEALEYVNQLAKTDDLILVSGSLYTVAESKQIFVNK